MNEILHLGQCPGAGEVAHSLGPVQRRGRGDERRRVEVKGWESGRCGSVGEKEMFKDNIETGLDLV